MEAGASASGTYEAAGPVPLDLAARLGARLAQKGLVTLGDLERATQAAQDKGVPFEEALVALGVVTEDQVGAVLADELGVAFVFPYAKHLDTDLVRRFPPDLLRRHTCVPIVRDGDNVVVAVARPLTAEAQRELASASGTPITFSLASQRLLQRVLGELLGDARDASGHGSVADPSAVSLLYGHLARAVATGASEIRFESDGSAIRVLHRIADGLHEAAREPLALMMALVARVQVLLGEPAPAPGIGMQGTLRTILGDNEFVLRIAILPTRLGESILVKLQPDERAEASAPADNGLKELAGSRRGLILIASAHHSLARRIGYELLRRGPPGRVVVTVEREAAQIEPRFRQMETQGRFFDDGISWALAYEPDALFVGEPPAQRHDLDALLAAAAHRLVVVACPDPDSAEAAIGWLERGARPSVLARVLAGLIDVGAGAVKTAVPTAALREAIDRGGPPGDIRRAMQRGT